MKKSVEERRSEILDVTCDVVVERGFGSTRIADVADRLGVSTGLIHYHFDSKDQLLAEAFQHAAARDLSRLEAELADAPSALVKLSRTIDLYAPEDAEPGWMLWIDAWGEALRNPTLKHISQELDVAWKDRLEAVIREGVANGEFRCADPHASAWRLAALLDGLGVQVTVHEGVLSRSELRAWVLAAATAELDLSPGAFNGERRRRPRSRSVA
ncbi:MAG TPA: TetR/AcrR family transcriptional regulator [Acidimicrobiales bacterium]|nr:TetR/AcrR family transcriptional regulator [Acidimicrobiales bacterium]